MSRPSWGALALLFVVGCRSDRVASRRDETNPPAAAAVAATQPAPPAARPDPDLARDQEDYISDVMAFAHLTHDQVRARMKLGSTPLKDEWNGWEKQGAMTPERITAF